MTDDATYHKDWADKFQDFISEGRLDFGPAQCVEGESVFWKQGEHFRRQTSVNGALIEFKVLSNCVAFHGTSGNSVWFVIEWLNNKYGTPFLETSFIGKWPVPDNPGMKFRQNCRDIITKAVAHLIDPTTYNISNEQANILDFLADYHLEDIYKSIVKALRQTVAQKMSASVLVKNHVLKDSRVARLSRERFNAVAGGGPPDSIGSKPC